MIQTSVDNSKNNGHAIPAKGTAAGAQVPFAIELLSPEEYEAKYKVYRYVPDPYLKLFDYLDTVQPGVVIVLQIPEGETPKSFCDRIARTFRRWYEPTKNYTLDVGQEHKGFEHVRIVKTMKSMNKISAPA